MLSPNKHYLSFIWNVLLGYSTWPTDHVFKNLFYGPSCKSQQDGKSSLWRYNTYATEGVYCCSNIRIISIILYRSIVWHCYVSIYIYRNLYKDIYVWRNRFIQRNWTELSSVCFLYINIFRHTYISLYRFLYIFWYITMSNYASIKNNWYKSYVTHSNKRHRSRLCCDIIITISHPAATRFVMFSIQLMQC